MSSDSLHDPRDIAARRADLDAADHFLSSLAQGKDVSEGRDPLAKLLLELKAEVDAPLSPAPDVRETVAEQGQGTHLCRSSRAQHHVPPRGVGGSLRRRHHAHRQHPRPWAMSLIGASVGALAASALIVAGGTAVYNADPGGPLWGARTAIFGKPEASLVQLASAFEQVDDLRNKGDVEGARHVINETRELIKYLDARDQQVAQRQLDDAQRSIDAPITKTSVSATTVTETMVVTETETRTMPPTEPSPEGVAGDPLIQPDNSTSPSTKPTQSAPKEPADADVAGGGDQPRDAE